jgi:hypothetical protein
MLSNAENESRNVAHKYYPRIGTTNMTIRNYINITERFSSLDEDWASVADLRSRKQTVLDALDRLLGCQSCTKGEKLAALREIEAVAKRMADGIEQRLTMVG